MVQDKTKKGWKTTGGDIKVLDQKDQDEAWPEPLSPKEWHLSHASSF